MAIFKCKMCGGQLDISEGMTVCECEYCGTQQTLPKSDNEQSLNLINRANHFRQQCEFDKAAEIYEKLIAQNDSDAELYWSLVLCRYGIEYVDDPLTKRKIATCHRTQFKSILEDTDYLSALQYADLSQKPVYESEAAYIDKIQKGILEISNKEDPFDVFICYKETDANGKRTQDSVLAQELYYQLEREGFKVFFSRITLEGKLGAQYEPYIFAALNSAKVMVVVGTKPEYFNAVWVKNEWSRYLMLMQEDRSRTLIPAYKDMDPYDLPDALSMFQAQDMSKLGFMQDLIRGISKIAKADEPKPQVVQQTVIQNAGNTQTEPLLKRVKLFLEDGDWNSAKDYSNRVLDLDPECAQAYYYLLMTKLKIRTEQDFDRLQSKNGIKNEDYYNKAYRFADDALKARLDDLHKKAIYNLAEAKHQAAGSDQDYVDAWHIYEKISGYQDASEKITACKDAVYEHAASVMNSADTEKSFREAAAIFALTAGFKDADQKQQECLEKADFIAKDTIYQQAVTVMDHTRSEQKYRETAAIFAKIAGFKDADQKQQDCLAQAELIRKDTIYKSAMSCLKSDQIERLEEGAQLLNEIPDYQDAVEQLEKFKAKIEETKARENAAAEAQRAAKAKAKKQKTIAIASVIAVVVLSVIGTVVGINIHKSNLYKSAISAFESGDYDKAIKEFTELEDYKDSVNYTQKAKFNYGIELCEQGSYDEACEIAGRENFTEMMKEAGKDAELTAFRKDFESYAGTFRPDSNNEFSYKVVISCDDSNWTITYVKDWDHVEDDVKEVEYPFDGSQLEVMFLYFDGTDRSVIYYDYNGIQKWYRVND